jgi:hypothetical protein
LKNSKKPAAQIHCQFLNPSTTLENSSSIHCSGSNLNWIRLPSLQKLACLDFCEAQQSAAVTDHTDGLADPGFAPVPFLTGLLAPADHQMSPQEAFGIPNWSEPPVSIRYLRLTI